MARVNIEPSFLQGSFPGLPIQEDSQDLPETAADPTNHNMTPLVNKKTVLIAHNSHASTGYTVTVTSVPDQFGRSGDIDAYLLAAGEIAAFGPFETKGWAQPSGDDAGSLYFQANNAAVKFIVLQL